MQLSFAADYHLQPNKRDGGLIGFLRFIMHISVKSSCAPIKSAFQYDQIRCPFLAIQKRDSFLPKMLVESYQISPAFQWMC